MSPKVDATALEVDGPVMTQEKAAEPVVEGVTTAEVHTGAMIAIYPPPEIASALAVEGGEAAEDLHLTLAFLGKAADLDVEALRTVVAGWARTVAPLSANVQGVGVFANSHLDTPVTWASVDVVGLSLVRERLVQLLLAAGLPVALEHDFTPHVTLLYEDRRDLRPESPPFSFDEVHVVIAGEHHVYGFAGRQRARVTEAQVEAAREVAPNTTTVLDYAGRTFLTTPATVHRESASNPHIMWIEGAYVGSEVPNRNNAMWTTADLEFGAPTVTYGPLNWLHEGRHVVGMITDSQLVRPSTEIAGELQENAHIRVRAGIWTWLYPEEAQIVEQAAEWNRLALSMECISETATCVGDNGCGQTFSYEDLILNRACDHLRERSSVRRMNNPTFLGAALIVPPARPGWAYASANLATAAFVAPVAADIPSWEAQMTALAAQHA